MKRTILIAVGFLCVHFFAYGQTLDYSNYHLVFQDDFKTYASSTGTFPTNDFATNSSSGYYTAFHKNWATDLGDYPGPRANFLFTPLDNPPPSCGTLPSGVSMSSWGVIRLTDYLLSTPCTTILSNDSPKTSTYATGAIRTTQNYGYGIIEASMIIAHDPGPNFVSSAFWMNPGGGTNKNEIDIIDVSENGYLVHRLMDYSYADPINHCITFADGWPDLSTAFHTYSCLWDPTGVSFYLDGNFIRELDYQTIRTYPNFQSFSIALQTITGSSNHISMYINQFNVYAQNCDASDAIITTGTLNPGLQKSNTITLTSPDMISAPNDYPVILEADAVTINSNFTADESSLLISPPIHFDDTNNTWCCNGYTRTQIANNFFEILPLNCSQDGNYGSHPWYRQTSSTDTAKVNTQTSSKYSTDQNGNNYLKTNIIGNSNYEVEAIDNTNSISSKTISIFPNPAKNNITISYPCNADRELVIDIKDVAGRTVYAQSIRCSQGSSTQQDVDISSLNAGIYFVNLSVNDQYVVKKLVKL